jgi:hypothetical protein
MHLLRVQAGLVQKGIYNGGVLGTVVNGTNSGNCCRGRNEKLLAVRLESMSESQALCAAHPCFKGD